MTIPDALLGLVLRRAWPDGDRLTIELIDADSVVHPAQRHADGTVELGTPGRDRRLPGLAHVVSAAGGPGRVVGHRLGRRAVVRTSSHWVKALRPSKVSAAATRHRIVSRAVARWPGTLRLASLDAVDEHAGTLTFSPIDGTPFLDAPDVIGSAAAVGTALTAWRGVPIPDELLLHTASDERTVLADWRERALRFGVIEPGDISNYLAVMTAADEALARLHHRPTVLAHRDLHDGQLLLAGDLTVGVLDLDTACRADPALDLGNLLAHIDLAAAEGRLGADTADAASAALLHGAATDSPRDRLAVDAYRAASRARLVAVHAFRPRTRRAARELLTIPASIRSLRRAQPVDTSR